MSNNTESKGDKKPLDLNDVEMVFGTPSSPKKDMKPDIHITNERKNGSTFVPIHKQPNEIDSDTVQPNQPLLEPDKGRQKPPLAGPEIDDLGEGKPNDTTPFPGIDDGLLENNNTNDNKDPHTDGDDKELDTPGNGVNTEDGKWNLSHGHDETDFYYGDVYDINGLHNRAGEDRPGSPMPGLIIPDVNTYQQKKNLAQGMMDLALLSANANQLRYVLEASSQRHPYYYPSLIFITCSIVLQIAVGIGLILNSRYDVNDKKEICKADKINNRTVIGIFLITIVNVFITSFSVAPVGSPTSATPTTP